MRGKVTQGMSLDFDGDIPDIGKIKYWFKMSFDKRRRDFIIINSFDDNFFVDLIGKNIGDPYFLLFNPEFIAPNSLDKSVRIVIKKEI